MKRYLSKAVSDRLRRRRQRPIILMFVAVGLFAAAVSAAGVIMK